MISMDKITRTKLAMLVTSVLLTVFTTIGLYYTMTVSQVSNLGVDNTASLNFAMVVAIMIAFMWVVCLILFYEFKTDDAIKSEIVALKARNTELEQRSGELEEFRDMLKATTFTPAVYDPDVLKSDAERLADKMAKESTK